MNGTEPYQPRRVRSDTALYALTAVWFGPNGAFPPARYTAWLFGIVVALTTFLTLIIVTPLEFIPRLILAAGAAPGVGVSATKRVFAHIDYYMPLRAWIQVFSAEMSTPRPPSNRPHTHTMAPQRIRR